MRILWVEDEIANEKTDFFARYADNVECKKDFFESLYELKNNLHHYDFLVLDIDLRHASSNNDNIEAYLTENRNWELNKDSLLAEAGFHLFLAAFQQRFPTERISFFTGNINPEQIIDVFDKLFALIEDDNAPDEAQKNIMAKIKTLLQTKQYEKFQDVFNQCLDNGSFDPLKNWAKENFNPNGIHDTANIFIERFKNARITQPQVFDKKKLEDKAGLMAWLGQHFNSQHPDFPYLTLRRGLLDTLKEISKNSYQLKDKYNEILDKDTFIEGIEWLLKPLHHYRPKNGDDELYLILCDYLSKPFDNNSRPAFSPLRNFRNRMAHGNIRQSPLSRIKPETVAFLFLLAMEELLQQKIDIAPFIKLFEKRLTRTSKDKLSDKATLKQKKCEGFITQKEAPNINFIECFYLDCLCELEQNHRLYSYLYIAYQQE
jgi:hypothetical protein